MLICGLLANARSRRRFYQAGFSTNRQQRLQTKQGGPAGSAWPPPFRVHLYFPFWLRTALNVRKLMNTLATSWSLILIN
jgi:hypothetical protein